MMPSPPGCRLSRGKVTSGAGRDKGSNGGPSSATTISRDSPSRRNQTSKACPGSRASRVGDDVGDDLVQGDLQRPDGFPGHPLGGAEGVQRGGSLTDCRGVRVEMGVPGRRYSGVFHRSASSYPGRDVVL